MASLFDIGWRSSKSKDQEIAESLLGAVQIVRGVQLSKDIIVRNPAVECRYQAMKPVASHHCVDF
jgi:hypothetical protein